MTETAVHPPISPSDHPSVCPIYRQQQRSAADLLLSAPRAGDIDRQQAPALRSKRGQCFSSFFSVLHFLVVGSVR